MNAPVFAACVAVALSAAVPATAAAAATDPSAACAKTIIDYALDRDSENAKAYAGLFTDDAEISFGGRTYTGKTKIVEELATAEAKRPRTTQTRHVLSNIRIDRVDATTARGAVYLNLYIGPINPDGSPSAVAQPIVGVYDVTFKLSPAGCKIYRSKLAIDFLPPRPPA